MEDKMNVYTGKTLDDILNKVAKEKNVERETLTYFITEEKQGFLGFGASVTAEVFAPSDVKDYIDDYLNAFFEGLGQDVEIETEVVKNNVNISLNAENNAILIGKNGRSLQGINTLLRQVINSTFKRRFYVMVDINNYKQDRYQKLKNIGRRVAKTVQRTKVAASLDPMPNDERRIIHKELSGMKNIRTESEGQGNNRHLKIFYEESKE